VAPFLEHTNANSNTHLGEQRTAMAAERTLMAWIRTSLAMITFGFTIGRLGEVLSSREVHLFGRTTDISGVAYFLVIVGTLALILAAIQYRVDIRVVSPSAQHRFSVTFIVAILLSVLGLVVFADLVTRL
jgi:putative membrane protein